MNKSKSSRFACVAVATIAVVVVFAAVASFGSWNAVAGDANSPGVSDTYTRNFLMSDAPQPGEQTGTANASVETATATDEVPVRLRSWQYTDGGRTISRGN